MEWLNPHYFWTLVLIPIVAGLFVLAALRRRQLAERFGEQATIRRLAESISPRRRRWKAALKTAGIALIVLALIGPRFGTRLK